MEDHYPTTDDVNIHSPVSIDTPGKAPCVRLTKPVTSWMLPTDGF